MINKTSMVIALGLLLIACTEKNSEEDYKFDLIETKSIVEVTRDKAMTCKGRAMMGNTEGARKCLQEFVELSGEGSRYQQAVKDFFKRVEVDESRKKEREYQVIVKNIALTNEAGLYVTEYLKSN